MTDLFTKTPKINRYFIPDTKNEDEFMAMIEPPKIVEKSVKNPVEQPKKEKEEPKPKKRATKKRKHTTEVHFDFFQFHEKLKYDEMF